MRSSPRKARPNQPESTSPAGNGKRRGFLLALGAGGVGAVALAARSLRGAKADPEEGGSDDSPGAGYRLTDHVKRYYRTTKI